VRLIRRGEHTEGVSEICEFTGCREPSAGELRAHFRLHKLPWGMCDEHLKPEHHPEDLHGKLHRW
jgi:hypothetical protein